MILDVVYNHTAEAGPLGPTLSFRGLDDRGYYQRVVRPPVVKPDGERLADTYWDVSGCGNTVDSTHTQSLRMILDSLRYWVTEMHVDGFRFDLMSALTRTNQVVDMGSHLITAIGQDPVLRHVKLVAEPWDASMDGYRVGQFPPPWIEWNDQFRDTVRDFWRGHARGVRTVATRLAGSSDLYADDGRSPYASVNFITAHDGFTLRDLVSYNDKHNEANGEDNRDGTDNNRSWNCGVEGETDDAEVLALRRRQAANLMATLCFSSGVPMLTAGDERGRTQRRQQQRLRPGQRDLVDRLAPRRRVARPLRHHQDRAAPASRAPRRCGSGTGSRGARPSGAASRTWCGSTRAAARCPRPTGTTTRAAPSACSSTGRRCATPGRAASRSATSPS